MRNLNLNTKKESIEINGETIFYDKQDECYYIAYKKIISAVEKYSEEFFKESYEKELSLLFLYEDNKIVIKQVVTQFSDSDSSTHWYNSSLLNFWQCKSKKRVIEELLSSTYYSIECFLENIKTKEEAIKYFLDLRQNAIESFLESVEELKNGFKQHICLNSGKMSFFITKKELREIIEKRNINPSSKK